MKIEEMFPSDFVKINRKSFKIANISGRSIAKKILLVIAAGVMCIGSYHYGYESNQNAVKTMEDKVAAIESSLNDIHRSKRDVDDSGNFLERHLIQKRTADNQQFLKNGETTCYLKRFCRKGLPSVTTTMGNGGGATYTRWGRRDCSRGTTGTSTVYEGIAAGSHHTHHGGGSNVLCANLNVSYTPGKYIDGHQGGSYVYGFQYQDGAWVNPLFDFSDIEAGTFTHYDVPCAVCLAHSRVSQLMIPGSVTCPAGWTKEYTGYILASHHGHHHSTDYICVDDTPQIVPGSDGDQGAALLYVAEGSCPSLQCGPYVNGREFRCVVCTL